MHNSTVSRRSGKPKKPNKPHPDFPLTPHPSGRWCKKVRGKLHYFGKWTDDRAGEKALAAWLDQKDDLLAGRVPRAKRIANGETVMLEEVVGRFLDAKAIRRDAGNLSPYTWQAYHSICRELVKAFSNERLVTDILPEDFDELYAAWSKRWGAARMEAEVRRAKTVFHFAERLIKKPIDFGETFAAPTRKAMRQERHARGPKMFEADELRRMIDGATQPLKAMLLLAINAGFGNNDVALLPLSAIDLAAGWINFPRPKTGIMRRVPLWKETVAALREWLAIRPTPASDGVAGLVFVTVRGDGWGTNIKDRPITHACRKLLDKLKINGSRNFYGIRHTFETIAGESIDQVAVNAIMGHDDGSMANTYRERISDDRLKATVNHVRKWLHAKERNGGAA